MHIGEEGVDILNWLRNDVVTSFLSGYHLWRRKFEIPNFNELGLRTCFNHTSPRKKLVREMNENIDHGNDVISSGAT